MSRYHREKPRLAIYLTRLRELGWREESAAESTGDDARVEIVAVRGKRRLKVVDARLSERLWELDVSLLGPGWREVVSEYNGARFSTRTVLDAIGEADEWASGGEV
mgnify:CR=1 FL=1